MARYLYGESTVAFARHRPIAWRALAARAGGTVRIWLRRRQLRQELRDYVLTDHRATADMGVTETDVLDWAERPFWRP